MTNAVVLSLDFLRDLRASITNGIVVVLIGCFEALYDKFTVAKVRDVYEEIVYTIGAFMNLLSWRDSASSNHDVALWLCGFVEPPRVSRAAPHPSS